MTPMVNNMFSEAKKKGPKGNDRSPQSKHVTKYFEYF